MEGLLLKRVSNDAVIPEGVNDSPSRRQNGLKFCAGITMALPPRSLTIVPTGWEIRLPDFCFGRIRLYNPSLTLLHRELEEQYFGPLQIAVENTSDETAYVIEGHPLFLLTVLSCRPMQFTVIDDFLNPNVVPDSTVNVDEPQI